MTEKQLHLVSLGGKSTPTQHSILRSEQTSNRGLRTRSAYAISKPRLYKLTFLRCPAPKVLVFLSPILQSLASGKHVMFGRCSVMAVLHCDLHGIPDSLISPTPSTMYRLVGVEGLEEHRAVAHAVVSPSWIWIQPTLFVRRRRRHLHGIYMDTVL